MTTPEPTPDLPVVDYVGRIRDAWLGLREPYSREHMSADMGYLFDEIERLRADVERLKGQQWCAWCQGLAERGLLKSGQAQRGQGQ